MIVDDFGLWNFARLFLFPLALFMALLIDDLGRTLGGQADLWQVSTARVVIKGLLGVTVGGRVIIMVMCVLVGVDSAGARNDAALASSWWLFVVLK